MSSSSSRARACRGIFSAGLLVSVSWLAVSACGTGSAGTRIGGGAPGNAGGNAGSGSGGVPPANTGGSTTSAAGTGIANSGAATEANGGSTANGGNAGNGGSTANGGNAGSGGSTANGGNAGSGGGNPFAGCSANGLLFCDDFEKLAAGPVQSAGPWSTASIGQDAPTIVIDATTKAHSGSHSVKVHAPVTDFQSFLVYHDGSVLPRAQGAFYLRAYVRLGRDMAADHNAYLVIDRAAAAGAGAAVRLGEQAQMLSLTVGGDAHGALSNNQFFQDHLLGAHLSANTWGCLEGYFNSAQPEIDFWLNGAEIADFHHSDWPADPYDTLHFGFEKYAGPELDIWFDDIALSATRIGCE